MTLYVVEIEGRGIAAFIADSASEAQALADSPAFRSDLAALESANGALWNGKSELFVREADPQEELAWVKWRTTAILANEADGDDNEMRLTFLVPVRDPTGDGLKDKDDMD